MSARKSKDQSLPQARRESRTCIILNHLKHNVLFILGLLGINYFSSSILFVGMWLASCLRQSSGMVMRGRLKQVVRGSGAVLTKEVIIAWRGKCQQADAAIGSVASKLTTPDLKRMSSLLMVCPLGISSKATWTYLQAPGRETLGLTLSDLFIRHCQTVTCRLAGWSDETADQVHPWKFTPTCPSSALSQIFLSYSNQRISRWFRRSLLALHVPVRTNCPTAYCLEPLAWPGQWQLMCPIHKSGDTIGEMPS